MEQIRRMECGPKKSGSRANFVRLRIAHSLRPRFPSVHARLWSLFALGSIVVIVAVYMAVVKCFGKQFACNKLQLSFFLAVPCTAHTHTHPHYPICDRIECRCGNFIFICAGSSSLDLFGGGKKVEFFSCVRDASNY